MTVDFLQGMVLGLTAAVPLGPINLLMMNESLKSYQNGVFVGLGAMSADTTFLLLIFFGLGSYFENTMVLKSISFFGALFLLFMAHGIYTKRNEPIKKVSIDTKGSLIKHYTKGYVLTIFSPYTVLFWLSVATLSMSKVYPLYIMSGMLFAIFIWITLMPYFIYKTKHLISQHVYSKIALISAVIFSVFAFGMIIRLF